MKVQGSCSKMTKNFKTETAEQVWCPSERGALWDRTGCVLSTPVLVPGKAGLLVTLLPMQTDPEKRMYCYSHKVVSFS